MNDFTWWYWILNPIGEASLSMADAKCAIMNGYLAEINWIQNRKHTCCVKIWEQFVKNDTDTDDTVTDDTVTDDTVTDDTVTDDTVTHDSHWWYM